MKVITGSKGFIGSHLTKRLDNVIAIPHDKISATKLYPFDYFYFLSSYGNLAHQTDTRQIFKANIQDLASILLEAKDIKFKSFVFVSTSSVKLRTQTMYSRCKKASEEMLLAVMEKYDVPICIIRPYSVIGVGEQPEHLIPTLIRSCLTGKQMNFVGNATHDYIDVEDVVDGILSLSNHSARGIFELGTGVKTTNEEVLEMVEKITGKKANINRVDSLRPYDNQEWVSTNFKARGFGWLPRKSLAQSIQEMVKAQIEINDFGKLE